MRLLCVDVPGSYQSECGVYDEAYHGEKEMAGLVATVKGILLKELGLG